MLNRIVSVVGRVGRFGGESMERVSQTAEKVSVAAKPLEKAPISPPSLDFANSLEAKAVSGKGGPRAALQELAEKKPDGEKEEPYVEPLKEEDDTMANILEQAMTTPDVNQKPLPGMVSKTLEELPEAVGEKAENTPQET